MKVKDSEKSLPLSYSERTYRQIEQSGLISTYVRMVETDLHILAPVNVEDEAIRLVAEARRQIEEYIENHVLFRNSLKPLPEDETAPEIVSEMLVAAIAAGVGPMATVAGIIAEVVGKGLVKRGIHDLIVENGGDIYIARQTECTVAIFAGSSPLSNKVGVQLPKDAMPCGVCCSSGNIGHSLSLGRADAVAVTAGSTPLADAAATRIGNEVDGSQEGLQAAMKVARKIKGISGVAIVQGKQFGAWGDIELVRL